MTNRTPSVAAFVVELPADRFIEELFPALAWAATVQLGDPVIGSRLVERVLLHAWRARDEFATPELLYQHARNAAQEAIQHEADRRFETIRFDDASSTPLPGDLQSMTVKAVQQRLQSRPSLRAVPSVNPAAEREASERAMTEHAAAERVAAERAAAERAAAERAAAERAAAERVAAERAAAERVAAERAAAERAAAERVAAERVAAAHSSAPVNALAAPIPPTPVASDSRLHNAPAANGQSAQTRAPVTMPRRMIDEHHADGRTSMVARWAAKSAAAADAGAHISAGVAGLNGHAAAVHPPLRSADYIKQHEGPTVPPKVKFAIAAVVIVALVSLWRATTGPSPLERAVAALADTSGVVSATTPAEQRDTTLADGATVHLGSSASLRSSRSFASGARAMRVDGPTVVAITLDSASPTAIATGALRWTTYGVLAAFDQQGTSLLVQVDSGALELLSDSVSIRLSAGNTVRVDPNAQVSALSADERNAAFAWRTGRLATGRQSPSRVADEILQWYNLAVRYMPARMSTDSLAIDVPLTSVDSLIAALGASTGGIVTRDGRQLTVSNGALPAVSPAKGRAVAAAAPSRRPTSRPAARRNIARLAPLPDIKIPDITVTLPVSKPPV